MSDIKELGIEYYDSILKVWKDSGLPVKEGWRDRADQMSRQLQSGHMSIFGLKEDGKIVAVVMCSDDSRKAWINRLAVLPEYRGRGYAKKLIRRAEDHFMSRALKIICCQIEGYNKESLSLFQKAGYVEFEGMHYLTKRQSDDV